MVSIGETSKPFYLRGPFIFGLALFVGFALFAHRYSTFRISKNFREVDPGRFYRSAQLTAEELSQVVDKYGIKTVISLRGAPEHTNWYQEQVQVLKEKDVTFQAVWWTAEHFPPKEELIKYVDLLKTAEYPILIHCRVGSDRTGLATAIYAMDFLRTPKEVAIAQHLNFDYWHVETFKPAMVEFVKRYRGPDWSRSKYDECALENRSFLENPNCPVAAQTASADPQ